LETFFTPTKSIAAEPVLQNQKIVSRISVMHLLFALAVLQLAITFLTYQRTLSFDEAMWQYIGRNWFRNGLQPYAGGVDNKSPLIFALFGFSEKLFGVNYWFPRIIGICFQTAGIFFLSKTAAYYAGKKAGLHAALIYGLSLLWHATGGKYVSYTETFSVALSIAAFYLAITAQKNKDIFLSGIVCGIAIVFRFTACLSALAIFIHLISKKRNFFSFFSGTLLSVFLLVFVFFLSGIKLANLFTNMFLDNFTSGSISDHSLQWRISSLTAHFLRSQLILFVPVLLFSFLTKRINGSILVWLVCEFIGISIIGLYSNQHFKNLLPQLSLLSAFLISFLMNRYSISFALSIILTFLLFVPKTTEPIIVLADMFSTHNEIKNNFQGNPNAQPDENGKKQLGLWIRSTTKRNDKVFIAGYSAISQAYSERISPTIYFNVTQTAAAKKIFFEELNHDKPFMIAVPAFPEYSANVSSDIRNTIEQLVAKEYSFTKNLYGHNIYRRK
jgi:hypothetical protein